MTSIGIPETTPYEDVIFKMGTSMVSSSAVVEARKASGVKRSLNKVPVMRSYLTRLGLTDEQINAMNVIHISGTKGKGSTCSFCESILRHHGFKTGMFSSPHMNEVRERVRVNGKPLSKEKFAFYFWQVYKKLKFTECEDEFNLGEFGGMPAYFQFTVILALYVFIQEKVQASIFEVGLGGEYDNTNFFTRPVVCGVTALGLDHVTLLGDTIDEIAWHKAGILKPGRPAVTVEQVFPIKRKPFVRLVKQPPVSYMAYTAKLIWNLVFPWPAVWRAVRRFWKFLFPTVVRHPMEIMLERAVERQCPLYVAPAMSCQELENARITLGIAGAKQAQNAALSFQICKVFMENVRNGFNDLEPTVTAKSTVDDIPKLITRASDFDANTMQGLTNCRWPCRTQQVKRGSVTFYLDGAHTEESIENCAQWFKQAADEEAKTIKGKVVRILMFNLTKNRNPGNLLRHLTGCKFDASVFCPHLRSTVYSGCIMDHFDKMLTDEKRADVPMENKDTWDYLMKTSSEAAGDKTVPPSYTFPCILQALSWATQDRDPSVKVLDPLAVLPPVPAALADAAHIQILATGSLIMVGPILGILDPAMND